MKKKKKWIANLWKLRHDLWSLKRKIVRIIRYAEKICWLNKKNIGTILTSKDDFWQVGGVIFSDKSFGFVVRLVSRFFQTFKYAYLVHTLVFLWLICFACFYDLLNRGVFRTLTNIQDRAFRKNG